MRRLYKNASGGWRADAETATVSPVANILVVDDEPPIVDLVRFVLQGAGHKVTEAFDGRQALKALGVDPADDKAALPDLIMLDIMMPVMDGLTVFRRIKENPRTASVPVVILTAKTQTQSLFQELSAEAFFQKPFNPGELRAAVTKVLESAKR